tara:strand:+ start:3023 stop:3883 length:861 start_codon:yes stop_codon:yes gene_type:complete
MKIGFIGTGLMGAPMIKNLLNSSHKISIFNRTIKKAKKLEKYGAILSFDIKELVKDKNVVITMLTDDKAVNEIINSKKFLKNLNKKTTVIDMSSTKPITALKNYKKLKKIGVDFLDAPVSGGTKGAESATLAIMVGGEKKIFKKHLRILKIMGVPNYVGKPSSGQAAKLANQIIVGITIGAVSEAIILCKKLGLNLKNVLKALEGGWADSKILQTHGIRMIKNDFKPRGKVSSQLKDMENILNTAKMNGLNLPLSKIIRNLYKQLSKKGYNNLDHSYLYKEIKNHF